MAFLHKPFSMKRGVR